MEHISRTEGNHWESRSTHCCAEIRSRGCCCRYVFTTGVFPYVPMWEGNYRMLSELIESKDLAVGVLRVRGWGGLGGVLLWGGGGGWGGGGVCRVCLISLLRSTAEQYHQHYQYQSYE